MEVVLLVLFVHMQVHVVLREGFVREFTGSLQPEFSGQSEFAEVYASVELMLKVSGLWKEKKRETVKETMKKAFFLEISFIVTIRSHKDDEYLSVLTAGNNLSIDFCVSALFLFLAVYIRGLVFKVGNAELDYVVAVSVCYVDECL